MTVEHEGIKLFKEELKTGKKGGGITRKTSKEKPHRSSSLREKANIGEKNATFPTRK